MAQSIQQYRSKHKHGKEHINI